MGQGNGTTTGPNGPINLPRFTWCSPFLWNIFSQMTQEDTRIFHKYIDYHWLLESCTLKWSRIYRSHQNTEENQKMSIRPEATLPNKLLFQALEAVDQKLKHVRPERETKQVMTWTERGKHGGKCGGTCGGKWWKMMENGDPWTESTHWFHHCPRKFGCRQTKKICSWGASPEVSASPNSTVPACTQNSPRTWEPFRLQFCLQQSRAKHGGTPMVLRQKTVTMVLSENGRHSNLPYGCVWK